MKVSETDVADPSESVLPARLLKRGNEDPGIDSYNNCYNPLLKEDRLAHHIGHTNHIHIHGSSPQ